MVFPGRFSTGCKRCRQRKVKCDEGRPACRRCQIYGQPCPGYADQFHFRFDKTAAKQESSSQPPRRRSVPKPSSSQPLAVVQALPQNNSRIQTVVHHAGSVRPITIMPPPAASYDDISVCYFVRRFVTVGEDDLLPGHLSFLPSLYNPGAHGLLELATLSVAQMAAYNQFRGDKFRLHAYQNYGRAVRALRITIQNENEVTDDRVLAAVLLLCAFKDIGEEGWGDPSEHASGLYYILEKRGMEQLCTYRGCELFLLALIKLQVNAFLNQDDRYTDPGGLLTALKDVDPMLRAMSLMTRTVTLRVNLLKCVTNQAQESEQYDGVPQSSNQSHSAGDDQSTLYTCFAALDEFDTWDIEAETYWRSTFGTRNVPGHLGKLTAEGVYYDPKTACIIILVRCARMILLLSILEYYDAIRISHTEADAWRVGNQEAWMSCIPVLEQNIQLTIDDLLYCVPFAMGDRGPDGAPVSGPQDGAAALVVFQPVKLVTYCVYATPEQRERGQLILNRMKTAVGVRSAISWGDQASSSLTVDSQRPGAQALTRAMASLAISGTSTTLPTISPC